MAAYAATVTLDHRRPYKIGNDLRLIRGTVDITNYNTTLAEITDITKKFVNSDVNVILGGLTDNGYLVAWVVASKSIKAWYPSVARTHNHDLSVIGGGTIVTNGAFGIDSSDAFVKVEAGNDTIAKADVGTKGGVVSETLAAAAGSEVATDVDVGAVQFVAVGLG